MTLHQEAQHPEELHQLFLSGTESHDLEGLIALYEPVSVAVDLEGRPLDIDGLREFLTGFLASVKRLEYDTRQVLVAGDIALMSITWRAVFATQDGETTNVGITAEVARRQPDGTWRFVIDDPQFVDVVSLRLRDQQ